MERSGAGLSTCRDGDRRLSLRVQHIKKEQPGDLLNRQAVSFISQSHSFTLSHGEQIKFILPEPIAQS